MTDRRKGKMGINGVGITYQVGRQKALEDEAARRYRNNLSLIKLDKGQLAANRPTTNERSTVLTPTKQKNLKVYEIKDKTVGVLMPT